jgi:ankyrin
MKRRTIISLLIASALILPFVGCKEKSKTEKVIEKTKATVEDAGDAIKDAAHKTGKAIEQTAEKTWDGIKKGAHEVGHVATNVVGEVKAGAEKVGEKFKEGSK